VVFRFACFVLSGQTEQVIGSDPASQQTAISNGIVNTDGVYN